VAQPLGMEPGGAKRTRIADPLLAKSAQGVRDRLWPGVTRFVSPSESGGIWSRWCQFVPWVMGPGVSLMTAQVLRPSAGLLAARIVLWSSVACPAGGR
jgi:hypothetical protein